MDRMFNCASLTEPEKSSPSSALSLSSVSRTLSLSCSSTSTMILTRSVCRAVLTLSVDQSLVSVSHFEMMTCQAVVYLLCQCLALAPPPVYTDRLERSLVPVYVVSEPPQHNNMHVVFQSFCALSESRQSCQFEQSYYVVFALNESQPRFWCILVKVTSSIQHFLDQLHQSFNSFLLLPFSPNLFFL